MEDLPPYGTQDISLQERHLCVRGGPTVPIPERTKAFLMLAADRGTWPVHQPGRWGVTLVTVVMTCQWDGLRRAASQDMESLLNRAQCPEAGGSWGGSPPCPERQGPLMVGKGPQEGALSLLSPLWVEEGPKGSPH